jgi:hypothetical protein
VRIQLGPLYNVKDKANNGYLGVTEPISLSGPSEKYVLQTAAVEEVGFGFSFIFFLSP